MTELPDVGDVFEAPWGRYAFVRTAGDRAVLRDPGTPSRFVLPAIAELASSYQAHRDLKPDNVAAASSARQEPPSAPPPPADAPAPIAAPAPSCDDCGRTGCVWWCHLDAEGNVVLRFCSACLQRGDRDAAAQATLSSWRPPPGEVYASRGDVGSYDPPPAPAAPRASRPSRAEARNLWPTATAGAPR